MKSTQSLGVPPLHNLLLLWLAFYPVAWMAGLDIPYAVIAWAIFFFALKNAKFDSKFVVLVVFGVAQILSLCVSIMQANGTADRYIALAHNIFVFSLIPLTYIYFSSHQHAFSRIRELIQPTITFVCLTSIALWTATYIWQEELKFSSVIGTTLLTRFDYMLGGKYPRTAFLSSYVNGSAVLIFSLYSLYLSFSDKRDWRRNGTGLLVLAALLTTGSRVIVLLGLILFLLNVSYRPRVSVALAATLFSMLLAVALVLKFDIVSAFFDARQNSNTTRTYLYQLTIERMAETNIWTGLGIKPYDYRIPDYPLGSHSTYIGYIGKHGLIAIPFLLAYVSFAFYRPFLTALSALATKNGVDQRMGQTIGLLLFSSILFFEDIDSIEINAIVIGMLLASTDQIFKSERRH